MKHNMSVRRWWLTWRRTFGITIGAGTDVAMEAAKIVLMKSDPIDILNTNLLSKATVRKMKQDLV